MNKTKMIGTVGPSSSDYDILKDMILSGVDVIRINMAYASVDFARDVILNVRKIDLDNGIETGIMLDTRGPELRIGGLEKSTINLEKDKVIKIVCSNIIGNKDIISVTNEKIILHSKINDYIYINDGNVKLQVVDKNSETLICKIKNNGVIKSYSTINVPSVSIDMKFLSNYDRDIIKFATMMQVDYLALSHVKEEMDILDVNDLLIELNDNDIQILSKIENKTAINQIDKILSVSDGIIISRGDLGIEIGVEKVPVIQKKLIKKVKEKEKIAVVSTEMLASMGEN